MTHAATPVRTYWMIWTGLLALTLVMVVLDRQPMARGLFVAVMVAAMLTKASLIGWYFMHLRFESRWIGWSVLIGLAGMAALLYGLIAPDAARILEMGRE
ncbi:MAG: cytochrome C oxidase subunit IV family protein [Vicinamibacterales bacterium]|nr:cytochrome C oxidase subunit IV family protein [Vicinamibacterales bacterium]